MTQHTTTPRETDSDFIEIFDKKLKYINDRVARLVEPYGVKVDYIGKGTDRKISLSASNPSSMKTCYNNLEKEIEAMGCIITMQGPFACTITLDKSQLEYDLEASEELVDEPLEDPAEEVPDEKTESEETQQTQSQNQNNMTKSELRKRLKELHQKIKDFMKVKGIKSSKYVRSIVPNENQETCVVNTYNGMTKGYVKELLKHGAEGCFQYDGDGQAIHVTLDFLDLQLDTESGADGKDNIVDKAGTRKPGRKTSKSKDRADKAISTGSITISPKSELSDEDLIYAMKAMASSISMRNASDPEPIGYTAEEIFKILKGVAAYGKKHIALFDKDSTTKPITVLTKEDVYKLFP